MCKAKCVRLVEFFEIVLVLSVLSKEVQALLDDVFADNFEDLVLLERFTRDIERKVLRIDDILDKVEILGSDVLAIIHDEDAANVKLDVVALLFGLKELFIPDARQ